MNKIASSKEKSVDKELIFGFQKGLKDFEEKNFEEFKEGMFTH